MEKVHRRAPLASMEISILILAALFSMAPRRKVNGQHLEIFKDQPGRQDQVEVMERAAVMGEQLQLQVRLLVRRELREHKELPEHRARKGCQE
jgi:hypothetical protein